MNIGPGIQRLLKTRGMSQADLARAVERDRSTVHAWLHGRATPPLDILVSIASALGTTVDGLIQLSVVESQTRKTS